MARRSVRAQRAGSLGGLEHDRGPFDRRFFRVGRCPQFLRTATVVAANYLGLSAAGGQAGGNGTGISIIGSSNNTIGGTSAGSGNVISGNTGDGHLDRCRRRVGEWKRGFRQSDRHESGGHARRWEWAERRRRHGCLRNGNRLGCGRVGKRDLGQRRARESLCFRAPPGRSSRTTRSAWPLTRNPRSAIRATAST